MGTPPKKSPTLAWVPQTFLGGVVERGDGRALVVSVAQLQRDRWLVIAVETLAGIQAVEDVFVDHAHQNLGEFANLRTAQRAAEAFVKKWLRAKSPDACPCEEIVPSRGSRRTVTRRAR